MPIILTWHVFGYTITLRIKKKSNNRHSDMVIWSLSSRQEKKVKKLCGAVSLI